jgi:hypothetical protein
MLTILWIVLGVLMGACALLLLVAGLRMRRDVQS